MVEHQPLEDWAALPWRKLEKAVYRLQKRIYRAAQRGNVGAVHSLQRLLMKSEAARCVAVRRVTQDNTGKNTAGVDGVKAVPPERRATFVRRLRHPKTIKPQPSRRVWIPKPGKRELRPLGIPTMLNRAHQALVKLALEPEWEAKFEPNSYGFRPGRSPHDAIGAVFNAIKHKAKYVLDADIEGCFDQIAHLPLLEKLNTYPTMRRIIKGWLTAGVLIATGWEPTERGSPQGGVASPLLANVALHGLETAIQAAFPTKDQPLVIRYADDFAVLHATKAGADRAQEVAEQWLRTMGLHLKPSKTRIVHTLHPGDGQVGFDFLGFHIRQYPVGRTHSGHNGWKQPLGFKTIITPSKDAIKRHRQEINTVVRAMRTARQADLIATLNPLIRGWANYYRTVAAKKIFDACDHWLFALLWRWARRRHPGKNASWVCQRYWHTVGGNHWVFAAPKGYALTRHAQTPIQRHAKVRGTASPFDGNIVYWSQRLQQHPLLTTRAARLLKRQQGRCTWCGLHFVDKENLEIDHVVPRSRGGNDTMANLQVLHGHCHNQKTAKDGSSDPTLARGIHDKDDVAEEPCAPNGACTVLQTSRCREEVT